MTTPTVFISYSHDSQEHADRVLDLAARLGQGGINVILDQYESSPPEGWPRWMDKHIRNADFVLMVCTETYFRRVMGEEKAGTGLGVKWEGNLIYQHFYNADTTNQRFIPVLYSDCKIEHIPTPLQGATYYSLGTAQGDEDLYRRLTNQPRATRPQLGTLQTLPPRTRKPDYLGPRISLAKLPSTSPDLFGREDVLARLDAAWNNPAINVFSLVAFGGVGKTALVNKWLSQLALDNYSGAARVFGWSFYSQGAAEGRQVSADPFIAYALDWFGDPDSTKGSPWDKGERLAALIRQQRTLLILDGLEPLQNPPPVDPGRIKDPALCTLLRELARQNPGLVVISTRLPVDDLKDCIGTSALEHDLEDLSPKAGAQHLKHLGVIGPDAELQQASIDFGNHALALTLLGTYLKTVHHGDVHQRDKMPKLINEHGQGPHARRVMTAYERWFKGKPELDILRLMGLFDRPAEPGAIKALREEPPIQGLTDNIQRLSHEDWQFALNSLRTARLLEDADPASPDTLDCHPLLREHFADQLSTRNPDAWRQAHSRLYEYYKSAAKKEFPDTIEEMSPLYAAVAHGCKAELYQDSFILYLLRIQRGAEFYSATRLGTLSADLATVRGFFKDDGWNAPADELGDEEKSATLIMAGFLLHGLGRVADAIHPFEIGMRRRSGDGMKITLSIGATSQTYLALGRIGDALASILGGIDFCRTKRKEAFSSRRCFEGSQWWAFGRALNIVAADIYHQAGNLKEAKNRFVGFLPLLHMLRWYLTLNNWVLALRNRQPAEVSTAGHDGFAQERAALPMANSIPVFWFCDLLLSQGRYRKAIKIAGNLLRWQTAEQVGALDRALIRLALGSARLASIEHGKRPLNGYESALKHLHPAVRELEETGLQYQLPTTFLARAAAYRLQGELSRANEDVNTAMRVARRSGMRLHEADCHLEYARQCLANGEKDNARDHLAKAETLINDTGYHRRDRDCQSIRDAL